jgi:hypothetical protein
VAATDLPQRQELECERSEHLPFSAPNTPNVASLSTPIDAPKMETTTVAFKIEKEDAVTDNKPNTEAPCIVFTEQPLDSQSMSFAGVNLMPENSMNIGSIVNNEGAEPTAAFSTSKSDGEIQVFDLQQQLSELRQQVSTSSDY